MPPIDNIGKTAKAITIIPTPPSHWRRARQIKIPLDFVSKFSMTVAPVVVIPDVDSKKASTKLISISDDSGLEILALNNKPGIYSARWAKRSGSFEKAMITILKKLKNNKNRKARFICSLSIKLNEKKMITTVGIIYGNISFKILGNKGFGYDSIFIPNSSKLTFGQISAKKKMKIDHRSIAFKRLKKKLKLNKFFIWNFIHI